ncbi:hypothetical protein [Crocosphaera sp. XPORK-15E]|uniref:hypothetical protein n=1 Tax=Crocosphaera sp. XPORK-15E TaxID=3110247 RepID=UPI002B20B57B|nr:hypothetical protein [Crocosphaera sp. XPORK-15E]MEA5536046.1 hypothetical protein [Crocosphaera sp. XPORK-15E]
MNRNLARIKLVVSQFPHKMYHQKLKSEKIQSPLTLEQRRAFLKLPLSERRRILSQQAADLEAHYQQNTDWKEFLAGDIIDD